MAVTEEMVNQICIWLLLFGGLCVLFIFICGWIYLSAKKDNKITQFDYVRVGDKMKKDEDLIVSFLSFDGKHISLKVTLDLYNTVETGEKYWIKYKDRELIEWEKE